MTLMKAKKPLALLLALLAALSLLGTTALAAGLPEETIAAQTELCGEDCGHTHEEVFSHTEHAEESLPEPEEIAVPVATPLLEQPEPEAEQPSDTSGVIPGSGIYWELNEYGWLMLSGNGSCPTFVSPDDQPWAAVREQITQVWFEDMDALSIPSLAYWFTGCTALTMAEIPYTTPVIGAAAFADCPSLRQIQLYYSGTFTIVPGAFSTGSLTPLLVLFIPEYDSVLGTLAAYDWTEDRRAAYFEDVYGITLLATGYCSNCKRTCSYTVEYEQWTNSEHCVRHWCSNCGYDQAGGVNGEAHSFRSGVCSKCGYSNGSGGGGGGGGNVCYHSSTRTSWSGCDWYEYCRSCGALVDYGTNHGTYVYGAWEYYSSSQHRRSYACSDCGEGTYRFMNYDYLQSKGVTPERGGYDAIYTGGFMDYGNARTNLDMIYQRFNVDHPADFKGHSLSVSDIVALKQNGVVSCHYVDSIGFRELPNFLKPENYLKNAEMAMEDDYGMIDGIINNGPKQPTVTALEEQVKAGFSISLTELAAASHREQKKPSVLEKLRERTPEQSKNKTAPKRSAEREL